MKKYLFPVIFGPTASGKTQRAYDLAAEQQANILSFDARQMYTDMDIGTGKDIPTTYQPQILDSGIKVFAHKLDHPQTMADTVAKTRAAILFGFDITSPISPFSIRHFYEYAGPLIALHRQHQKPLILVGGSWQYLQVLLNPPATLLVAPSSARTEWNTLTVLDLQTQVQQRHWQRWTELNQSDRANPRRLIRILEGGDHLTQPGPAPLIQSDEYEILWQNPPLDTLEHNIRQRIADRWLHGMREETQRLQEKYSNWLTPAFSATGYQEVRLFLEGKLTEPSMLEQWFLKERHYAKKQRTWMRKYIKVV